MSGKRNQVLKFKELKYSMEYAFGKAKISDVVIRERNVQLTEQQAAMLNSQFENSGIKYEEIKDEAPKRTRRTKVEVEAEKEDK